MAQQLFDFAAQFFVSRARLIEKHPARARLAFQSGVIARFDLAPALLVHLLLKGALPRSERDLALPASRKIGRSASASFHAAKKSSQAFRLFAVSPVSVAARASPRCASGYNGESGA